MAGCLLPPSGKSGNSTKNSSKIGSPYPSNCLGLTRAAQPAAFRCGAAAVDGVARHTPTARL
eukprot:6378788-Prymnesium_polylepis.1